MRGPDEAEFDELVAGRAHAMRRTAYLMRGDWHQAEDLEQVALLTASGPAARRLTKAARLGGIRPPHQPIEQDF